MSQSAVIQLDEGETRCYEWSVQIPPRSRIQANLSILESNFSFNKLLFTKGFLRKIQHQWNCTISKDSLITIQFYIRNSEDCDIRIQKCEIQAFSNGKLKNQMFSNMSVSINRNLANNIGRWWVTTPTTAIKVPDIVWDDSVDKLKIVFHIHREPFGRCILRPMPSLTWCDFKTEETGGLELSTIKYLASKTEPDVTLVAGGQRFHAHQVILTCKSPVFERMFQNEMKESVERRVEIGDIQPEVLKELLHFVYNEEFLTTDEDDNHNRMFVELFKAGHKYGMEGLASKCGERILERVVCFKNAGEMYALGETYNEVFKRKAVEIVKKNRSEAFKDSKSISDFFLQFPELAFEVFKK